MGRRGRKRKGKKLYCFRLYEETHHTLLRLMEELGLGDVEEALELLLSSFHALLGISAYQKFNFRLSEKEFPLIRNSISAYQFFNFCLSVIRNYREVVGRRELPETLQALEREALKGGGSFERPTPVAGATHPGRLNDPFGEYIGEYIGDLIKEEENNNKRVSNAYALDTLSPFREYSRKGVLPLAGQSDSLPMSVDREGEKELKESGNGDGVAKNSQLQKTPEELAREFEERLSEHRKRLSLLLQERGVSWKVERLMKVVEEWERLYGEWKEEWDTHLLDVLKYVHENRVVSYLRRFRFPDGQEPSFSYAISVPLVQIAKADAEGKEVVKTVLGEVKLKKQRKKTGMSERDVVNLWNEMAEKERLMKKTELTSYLKAQIRELLSIHPEKEWWEELFSLVPRAVKETKKPDEPRDLLWLFQNRRYEGKILDWVLSFKEKPSPSPARVRVEVFKERLRELCETQSITREELLGLLKEAGISLKGSSTSTVSLFGEEKVVQRLALLLGRKDYGEALRLLEEKAKNEEVVR